MATPHEYYLSVINKAFDEDGVYGAQCVDGFKHFCRTVLNYNLSHKSICSPTGYACSIWDNFDSLGLGTYFDKVAANEMVDGDWAIWSKGSRSCPYSHVAMFRKDNGNGTGVFLGQNQNGVGAFTQVNLYYDGLRGGLRPKIYHQNSGEKVDQILHVGSHVQFDGVFTVNSINASNNTFTCLAFTGKPTKDYHNIPSNDFDECDANGNTAGQNQILVAGSHIINNHTYEVKKIDKPSDSCMINISGKDVWIFCKPLKEV